jgi:hypothetical protein
MHRSVLEDEDFIAWANENIVVLVGNGNSTGVHKTGAEKDDDKGKDGKGKDDKKGIPRPEEEPAPKDGETAPEENKPEEPTAGPAADVDCTYYPGIKCAEHVKALQDVRKPTDGAPEVPEWKGIPATFLIGPDGTVEDCKEDRAPSGLQNAVEDFRQAPRGDEREGRRGLREGEGGGRPRREAEGGEGAPRGGGDEARRGGRAARRRRDRCLAQGERRPGEVASRGPGLQRRPGRFFSAWAPQASLNVCSKIRLARPCSPRPRTPRPDRPRTSAAPPRRSCADPFAWAGPSVF